MKRPQLYYVDGTAIAADGEHVFKEVVSGYSNGISQLEQVADVIKLTASNDGIYYLKEEGAGVDAAEKYLIASGDITACGLSEQDGSISSVLSPIQAYNNYLEGIRGIKQLLDKAIDDNKSNRILLRLLFIGVCGEFEGYLHTTILSLIQGSKDVFIAVCECKGLPRNSLNEHKWRADIINMINDRFQFQHIRNIDAKERKIYEKLIGEQLVISQELRDHIEWRNKLAHKVPYHNKPIYPSKDDVLNFIAESDKIVKYIDSKIQKYKSEWLIEF